MTSKQDRSTRKIELVETNNIALSLTRIKNTPGWCTDERRRRALYHASVMAGSVSQAIREALKLP